MASAGRQSGKGEEVRPAGSPRLYLLVCTACWQRPWECKCTERRKTPDKQHVTSDHWHRVPVFTLGDIREAFDGEPVAVRDRILEKLRTPPEPPRKAPSGDRRKLLDLGAEVIA